MTEIGRDTAGMDQSLHAEFREQLHELRNRLMPMRLRIDAGCRLAADTPLKSLFLSLQDSMREVQQLVDTMQKGEVEAGSADAASVSPASSPPGASSLVSTGRPVHVLLVDDNELLAEALGEYIGADTRFARMLHASSAASARRMLETSTPDLIPDLIVVDVNLPDADGLVLCRELRSRYPSVGVAVMSGMVDSGLLTEVHASGAAGFLAKGGEPAALLNTMVQLAGSTSARSSTHG